MDRSIEGQRENSASKRLANELGGSPARAMDMRAGGVPSPPENVKVRLFSEAIFLRMKKKRAGERGEGEKILRITNF